MCVAVIIIMRFYQKCSAIMCSWVACAWRVIREMISLRRRLILKHIKYATDFCLRIWKFNHKSWSSFPHNEGAVLHWKYIGWYCFYFLCRYCAWEEGMAVILWHAQYHLKGQVHHRMRLKASSHTLVRHGTKRRVYQSFKPNSDYQGCRPHSTWKYIGKLESEKYIWET